jgi:hypothetical protein
MMAAPNEIKLIGGTSHPELSAKVASWYVQVHYPVACCCSNVLATGIMT